MTASPRPASETLRLAKLYSYNILDTLPEAAYTDIAKLAAYICQTPTALVSFIDTDRQWFKASVGLDASETNRSVAFCNHTIQQTDVMVIPDAQQHPKFHDNPLVTGEPYIRFYAGAPLMSPDGHALGSLCVVDSRPHDISPNQIDALRVLSHQVVVLLELSYQTQQLSHANQTLEDRVQERTAKLTQSLHRLLNAQSALLKRETVTRQQSLNMQLTSLPDRNYFLQRLNEAVQRSQRQPKHQYAVLLIELSDMHSIRTTFGDASGSEALRQILQRTQALLRKSDLVACLGSNELAILLDNIPGPDQITPAIDRLRERLSIPLMLADQPVSADPCVGVVFSEIGYRRAEAVIRDVRAALRAARRIVHQRQKAQINLDTTQQQPNKQPPVIVQDEQARSLPPYVVFSTQHHTAHISAQKSARTFENELRQALLKQQFEVYYQPIFDLHKQVLIGVEALLRWHHPDRGTMPAREFIQVLEEIGLTQPLGEFVFEQGCRHLAHWRHVQTTPSLVLHVNLSLMQLQSPQLMTHLNKCLERYGLPAESIAFEIDESVLIRRDRTLLATLQTLKDMGFQLCINDFGRQQSSLSRLHQLQVDTLKIGQSFVHALTQPECVNIAKTILDLGRSTQMNVIAEGIETDQQLSQLLTLGCNQGQGYELAKPMSADEIQTGLLL